MSYIVPREMPKNCSTCPYFQYNMFDDDIDGYCKTLKAKITDSDERHPNCILIEIKTPHGRLIDADALKSKFSHGEGDSDVDSAWISTIRRFITQAETIIEAEEGSEE